MKQAGAAAHAFGSVRRRLPSEKFSVRRSPLHMALRRPGVRIKRTHCSGRLARNPGPNHMIQPVHPPASDPRKLPLRPPESMPGGHRSIGCRSDELRVEDDDASTVDQGEGFVESAVDPVTQDHGALRIIPACRALTLHRYRANTPG